MQSCLRASKPMLYDILALVDMRPNLTLAAAVLAVGLFVLSLISSSRAKPDSRKRTWGPYLALVAGPLIGVVWWAADLFLLKSKSYVLISDASADFTAHVVVGTAVGLATAVLYGTALLLSRPRMRR